MRKTNLLFTILMSLSLVLLLAAGGFAQVGPQWDTFRGGISSISTYNGVAAPIGSIVEIYDQDGILCGKDTVALSPGAGKYGNVSVLGDNLNTVEDEGPNPDETLTFMLNDRPTLTNGPDDPIYEGNWLFKEVNLEAEGIVDAAFTGPTGQVAFPGDVVHYEVMVENTGNGLDFYTITATSSNGWIVDFEDGFHYVKAGNDLYIGFDLLVPGGTVQTSDQIEFTVTSGIDASLTFSSNVLTMIQEPTDADDDDVMVPGEFNLRQNYPNPFNPVTTIAYSIPRSSFVNLSVYNLLGGTVKEFAFGIQSAGSHTFTFDASSLASGIYFYKLSAGDESAIRKMVLLK